MQFENWMGYVVPLRDAEHVRHRRVSQGDHAIAKLAHMFPKGGVCIQAGANWGYWPSRMGMIFNRVYTFEPDPTCFVCLCRNTEGNPHIFRYQAALGNKRALVDLERSEDTTGNQKVKGSGPIPTMRIDDLGLDCCHLIYLDIEGSEPEAVRGAMDTINRCSPVVIYEERKGYPQTKEVRSLLPEKYREDGKIGADRIMRPQ